MTSGSSVWRWNVTENPRILKTSIDLLGSSNSPLVFAKLNLPQTNARLGPENWARWNHFLRTYCNKKFRGWIAGSNPFCRLMTHWRSSDLGGSPWLVLACPWLALPALPSWNAEKNFSGPNCFFSSPRLLGNLIPRQNKLSSPGMVEYLAYSSVWNAWTWNSSPRLLCNLIPRQNELAKPSQYEPLKS